MSETNHLANIRSLINDGFHVDGSSIRAKDVIGHMPNSTIRSTMALIIGYMHAMEKMEIASIEVLPPAPMPMYDHRNDPANKKDHESD